MGGPNTTVNLGPGVRLLQGSKYYVTAPLCRAKPCSAIGKAESQLEAPFSPFSFETTNALCILVGSLLDTDSSVARFFSCSLLRLRAIYFDFLTPWNW